MSVVGGDFRETLAEIRFVFFSLRPGASLQQSAIAADNCSLESPVDYLSFMTCCQSQSVGYFYESPAITEESPRGEAD